MNNYSTTKESIMCNGEKKVSSTNSAGTTEQSHVEKQNQITLTAYTNINSNKDLDIILETIKYTEEKKGKAFYNISLSNVFRDESNGKGKKAKVKRMNKWDSINIERNYN